jgi:Gaa1-like, GPI transamidase component
MKMTPKASIFPLLDSLRNSFMGRLQYPHSYFMDVGCHAITFVTHGTDGKPIERTHRIADFMNVMEKVVRISDQLDEQLHAGFYFYLLSSPGKFISNSVFVWPGVCLVLGLFVP